MFLNDADHPRFVSCGQVPAQQWRVRQLLCPVRRPHACVPRVGHLGRCCHWYVSPVCCPRVTSACDILVGPADDSLFSTAGLAPHYLCHLVQAPSSSSVESMSTTAPSACTSALFRRHAPVWCGLQGCTTGLRLLVHRALRCDPGGYWQAVQSPINTIVLSYRDSPFTRLVDHRATLQRPWTRRVWQC